MTQRKKQHASYSQRNDFWQDIDMDTYFMSDIYRDKVDKAWDQHRYLWDKKYENGIDPLGTDRED